MARPSLDSMMEPHRSVHPQQYRDSPTSGESVILDDAVRNKIVIRALRRSLCSCCQRGTSEDDAGCNQHTASYLLYYNQCGTSEDGAVRNKSTASFPLQLLPAWDIRRFPGDHRSLLLLLLYAPVGLCLLLLRLFIGAHIFLVSCVLPDSVIKRCLMRVMTSVLGVFINESESHVRDKNLKIYISNHLTCFDHSVVSLITPCTSPSLSCSPGFLCWARGFLELGAPGSRVQLQESLKHYLSQSGSLPLLLFPEEETTNGKRGLLHFSSWAFSLSDSVQPLSILVQRPLVSPAVTGCPWGIELFWMLFVPFTVYHVRWLPMVPRNPKESDEDFASRVQKLIALSLGVSGTSHTAADRAELLKRRSREPPPPAPSVSPSPADSHMVQRVKEVLPQVPLSVIRKDLAHTGCVDTTITNLLEGRVPFVFEEESSPSSDASVSNRSTKSVTRGFGRRPEDRHMSLQERKEALYEYARRRYLDKFGPLEKVEKAGARY